MRINKPTLFLCLLFPLNLFAQNIDFSKNLHEDQKVFGVNKEAPHATFFPYANEQEALRGDKFSSKWALPLNGLWKFFWVRNPADKPTGFYEINYDDSNWDYFPVPANWEVFGFDYPIYLDEKYHTRKYMLQLQEISPLR